MHSSVRKYAHTYEFKNLNNVQVEKLAILDDIVVEFVEICENSNVSVHIPPHVVLQLAEGPLSPNDVEDLFKAAMLCSISGKPRPGYKLIEAALNRKEIKNESAFLVYKVRTDLNGRLDFITAGKPGRRDREWQKGSHDYHKARGY
jgi:hypothetical protein